MRNTRQKLEMTVISVYSVQIQAVQLNVYSCQNSTIETLHMFSREPIYWCTAAHQICFYHLIISFWHLTFFIPFVFYMSPQRNRSFLLIYAWFLVRTEAAFQSYRLHAQPHHLVVKACNSRLLLMGITPKTVSPPGSKTASGHRPNTEASCSPDMQ